MGIKIRLNEEMSLKELKSICNILNDKFNYKTSDSHEYIVLVSLREKNILPLKDILNTLHRCNISIEDVEIID